MKWQLIFCSILRTPTFVDMVGMHLDALHILLSTCGTCSIELMMNYHAPTIVQRVRIGLSKVWTFQGHVSACQPVFWKFLSVLQKEENMFCISIIQHVVGHPAPPPRQRYLDSSYTILRILDDYPNWQGLQYLREIAHNLLFLKLTALIILETCQPISAHYCYYVETSPLICTPNQQSGFYIIATLG